MFGTLLAGVDHLPSTYDREKQAFTKGEPEYGAHFADELERIVGLHGASTIAAVIVEPMAGSTGVLPPPKGYLQRLREITSKHGILLIFDEVITGFGRLGAAFAAERYGVTPDLMTFAKGVTNGAVPMGGVLVRDDIHDAFMNGPGAHDRTVPRLHLLGASARLRGRSCDAGHLSRRGSVRACEETGAEVRRCGDDACARSRTCSTSAPSASPLRSTSRRATARPASAASRRSNAAFHDLDIVIRVDRRYHRADAAPDRLGRPDRGNRREGRENDPRGGVKSVAASDCAKSVARRISGGARMDSLGQGVRIP